MISLKRSTFHGELAFKMAYLLQLSVVSAAHTAQHFGLHHPCTASVA